MICVNNAYTMRKARELGGNRLKHALAPNAHYTPTDQKVQERMKAMSELPDMVAQGINSQIRREDEYACRERRIEHIADKYRQQILSDSDEMTDAFLNHIRLEDEQEMVKAIMANDDLELGKICRAIIERHADATAKMWAELEVK
jgi:predicted adenine nucleotide alpha hydrolase (AANH) superfamily ATPase